MSFLTNVISRTASKTIINVAARLSRDMKKFNEGKAAGYKEGYADGKAGKPQKVK